MNPITRLYRASRAFRILCYLALVPVTAFLWLICDDVFEKASQPLDVTVLVLFILLGLWAWWYGERRFHVPADGD